MNIIVRAELPFDYKKIKEINDKAFNQEIEGKLVDKLREANCDIISLVAVFDNQVVGHIMFSPVEINNEVVGMGLAPIAVIPEFQNKGIGSELIKAGIEEVKKRNYSLIVVIGHAEYYSHFGFIPASKCGLKSEYDVPNEIFMALNFNETKWNNALVKYRPEFAVLA